MLLRKSGPIEMGQRRISTTLRYGLMVTRLEVSPQKADQKTQEPGRQEFTAPKRQGVLMPLYGSLPYLTY